MIILNAVLKYGFIGVLLILPGAFFAPVIHEFVKAHVSAALGDRTPKHNGFNTWNPLKFFEPVGFAFMLIFGVGWGQPVTTSPFYYKDKRKGIALTYTAPMVVNLLVGMVAVFVLGLLSTPMNQWAINNFTSSGTSWAFNAVKYFEFSLLVFGTLNINLALFNLIPIAPLGMSKIIHIFVSPETSMRLTQYEKPLQVLLILILVFEMHQRIIFPITDLIIKMVWI